MVTGKAANPRIMNSGHRTIDAQMGFIFQNHAICVAEKGDGFVKTKCLVLLLVALMLMSASALASKTKITILMGNITPDDIGPLFEAFQRENESITVEPMYVAWNEVDDKFLMMAAGGEAPDILVNNSVYGWARYALQDMFMDLGHLIERDKSELEGIIPPAWEAAHVGPVLSGMANLSPGFGVAYNATLFKEAGLILPPADWEDPNWNWNTMATIARKLTKRNSDGEVTQWGVGFWDADNLIGYAWAFGGDWFDTESYETGVVQKITLTQAENVEAYEAIAELRSTGAQTHLGHIWEGTLGMGIDGLSPNLLDPVLRGDSMSNFEWGFAPFPYPQDSARGKTFSWSGPCAAISAASQHPEAAWKLVKYIALSEDPAALDYHGSPWITPSRIQLILERYRERGSFRNYVISYEEIVDAVMGSLMRAQPLPRTSMLGATEVWDAVGQELIPALNGQQPIKAALEKAQEAAQAKVSALKDKLGL